MSVDRPQMSVDRSRMTTERSSTVDRRRSTFRDIFNFDSWIGADEEPWEEESKEIDDNWGDYFEFKGCESHESFQIMADFSEDIEDKRLQNKLINALNRPKPFQNFKLQIDNSGEYRQKWFDFKKMRYIQWVKKQIELSNKEFE